MCKVASKWGIYSSSRSRSCFNSGGGQQEEEGGRKESEAYIIYSGKSHVRCPNHKGHESVSKSSNHNWYYYKENYYKGVGSNNNIINLVIAEKGTGLG